MDTDSRLTTPATRRTIVATGAKLAYAAPLVAASLTLSATNAAARMSSPRFVCSHPMGFCDNANPDTDCFCGTVVPSGAFVCVTDLVGFGCDSGSCDVVTGAGCSGGTLCVVDEFSAPQARCRRLCGTNCGCSGVLCDVTPCCAGFVCSSLPGGPDICV